MTSVLPAEGSAYPRPVQELVPLAQVLVDRMGTLPSRNQLMREFKIGDKKAKAILQVLAELTGEDVPEPGPVGTAPTAVPDPDPVPELATTAPEPVVAPEPAPQVAVPVAPEPAPEPAGRKPVRPWPILFLALGAFVAIWSGWVGLGELTGFGVVHPLPGIWDGFTINSAITLPIGVETYAAYALRVWLSGRVPERARRFAKKSAIGSLVLGALGQVAYHLLTAAHVTSAPWPVTCAVACFPVAVLGMGAALAHLMREES